MKQIKQQLLQYLMQTFDPVVTLSTQDNTKLLQQLISGFKSRTKWNKYQSKVLMQTQRQYLN